MSESALLFLLHSGSKRISERPNAYLVCMRAANFMCYVPALFALIATCCCLVGISKSCGVNEKAGRGGGNRNCIPTKQVLHGQWHSATASFQLLLNVVSLRFSLLGLHLVFSKVNRLYFGVG